MGWIAAATSGLAAAVGVSAAVVGLNLSSPAGDPAVWIDGPTVEAVLAAGEVTVSAHATADDEIDGLVLKVDGQQVDRTSDLERTGKLVYATFAWEANEGEHVLTVAQDGDAEVSSAQRLVYVGSGVDASPAPEPTPSATPSPTPSPSASPTESETPSATPSATPSETETPSATPTEQPSPKPTRPTPKPTEPTPQPTPPTLGAVTVTPSQVGPNTPACTGNITVRANVSGAISGSARVYRTNLSKDIGGSISGGVFTATFKQADLYGSNTSGDFSVSVTVTNKAGSITKDGSFSVFCSKD